MYSSNSQAKHVTRIASTVLVICLLTSSTPAAPQIIVAVTTEARVTFALWFQSSGVAKLLQGQRGPTQRIQEKQRDRDGKIDRIKIFPGDVTVDVSDKVRFAAVAYDSGNNPIGGVKIRWSGQTSGQGRRVRISQNGEFEAMAPGSFTVIAEAKGRAAQVTVVVRPGERRDPNRPPIRTRQVSTRDLPTVKTSTQKPIKPAASERPVQKAEGPRRGGSPVARRAHANTSNVAPALPFLPDIGWDDTNYWSADDPGNGVGDPPGGTVDGGAGSGNFQITAPIYSGAGRGVNISLAASYNSRLWNKSGNQITYDIDRGWPAPGWSLGFGKILGMGVNNGGILIDANGTRHGYTGQITFYSSGTTGVMHTTDGSFIDYTYWTGTGGGIVSAYARYPNGTVVGFGAPGPGAVYPTSIEDANGNLIIITYVNNSGPRIQTVTDTLNRVVSFHYDANNLLTAITGPGQDSGTRTLARFHYQQLALNAAFSNLTQVVRDANPWMIDAIYYPGTGTGFWFGDFDSYSSYGMIAKVTDERNIDFAANSLNEMGTVQQGQITKKDTYNYPLSPDSTLTNAPTYTSMTSVWTRDGSSTDSATTGYLTLENATNPAQPTIPSRKVEVTMPNQTKSIQYSYNYTSLPDSDNRKALDGLVYQDVTQDSAGTPLQGSTATWEKGAYGAPRPLRVERTDERSQITATEFSYGSYNQTIEVREFDYGGTSLRRIVRTQYQNSAAYTSRHIFSLPLNIEVLDGNNNRVSRVEYQYDGETLTAAPNVVQHNQASNPHADAEGFCYTDYDWSDPDCQGGCMPDIMGCDNYCPQLYYCPYISATDYRGNVTQVTSYADAVNLAGATIESRRYDVTGNLVTSSASCCEQISYSFTIDTQYAYAQSRTRGSATDANHQVTTSATYDFNTGLITSARGIDGRVSSTSYEPSTLRVESEVASTGAHTDYDYDDPGLSITTTTYLAQSEGGAIVDQRIKFVNGNGQVRQERARGPNNGSQQTWDAVDTIYNNLGQIAEQSRPYRFGVDSPVFTTATFDALGRTKTLSAPDGSVTEAFYNETSRPDVASSDSGETTRVRDAWGRERWGRTDSTGRLVEVVEPNPNGNGTVASGGLVTTYAYNTSGNTVASHSMSGGQVEQTRSFKYDSLGRLLAQKLAETNATINDAGVYVGIGGAGAQWSDYFRYENTHSNLVQRLDARGVKTNYWYFNPAGHTDPGDGTTPDPLNRLQVISWDTSIANQNLQTTDPKYVLSSATVTYQYRNRAANTSCDPTDPSGRKDVTAPMSITTDGVSTEGLCYDSEGRASTRTLTLTSRSNYPFVTDYSYDSVGRVTDVRYPAEYLNGSARKLVHHDYDFASRLTGLTYDNQSFASNIAYNSSSRATSMNVGTGANQITENYDYNAQTGFLDGQTVVRAGNPSTTLLDLDYEYINANGKRTGQLTKIVNNLNNNKNRGYSYDALGRLVQATGGSSTSPLWTQTYSYDRYGNRTSVNASGFSASRGDSQRDGLVVASDRNGSPAQNSSRTSSGSPATLIARNDRKDPRPYLPEADKSVSDSAPKLGVPAAPPANVIIFTDDPLTAGTLIKAVHVTEVRDAINQVRAQAALSPASWAESISSGVTVKASHITEMRTRLDEARAALGISAASYTDPGLNTGYSVLAVHIQELRDRVRSTLASIPIPRDGHASLAYETGSNRITTAGFAYDAAGNQLRALTQGGASQRFQYDAANRLAKVKADDNTTVIATYTYGDGNERLIAEENGGRTYYFGEDGATIAEYYESGSSAIPAWSKSYIYLGKRLLSTVTPTGGGGEAIRYHHPDRLGTRLVTDPSNGTSFEQVTLPFGSDLTAESSGTTNRRFTSYERSATTRLDYAVNRHYDAQQGRFTQVDPAGMNAVNFDNPQTLNMYAYCANDPVNRLDPDGLGFLSFLKKLFRYVVLALVTFLVVVAIVVVATTLFPALGAFLIAHPTLTAILLGLVSIMAQHFVLTVYNGIADEIREHGFSLGSLFRGLARGLSRWFKSIINPKGVLGIAIYGNYCGPGNPNQSSGREPIDELDAACREHDKVYQDPNATSRDRGRADLRLSLAAARAGFRGFLSRTGNLFALFVGITFLFLGIGRLLFGGSGRRSEQPTTITASGSGGDQPRLTNSSRSAYHISMPVYPEVMNATPGRMDRFNFAGP